MVAKIRTKNISQTRFCMICGQKFKTTNEVKYLCKKCENTNHCVACGKLLDINTAYDELCCSEKCVKKLNIRQKKIKVCNKCGKEITNPFIYIKSDNIYHHVICEYNDLKDEIESRKELIEKYQSGIKNEEKRIENKIKEMIKEAKNTEKEIKEEEKYIKDCQKDIEELAKKYPEELVKEVL